MIVLRECPPSRAAPVLRTIKGRLPAQPRSHGAESHDDHFVSCEHGLCLHSPTERISASLTLKIWQRRVGFSTMFFLPVHFVPGTGGVPLRTPGCILSLKVQEVAPKHLHLRADVSCCLGDVRWLC